MQNSITVGQIDAVLPQTQCGLCGYKGCYPYAEAIALQEENINKCPPGGISTLKKLAALTGQDPKPYIEEMRQKEKPPMRAVIREDECIGCTKCIQACPVDAILGAAKQMHTVIANECTGCELCIAPCPVDCIDLISLPEQSEAEQKNKADLARQRYEFRNYRLEKNAEKKAQRYQQIKLLQRKAEIQAAVSRVKMRKECR
jgi:electron transport complex protein RnfB